MLIHYIHKSSLIHMIACVRKTLKFESSFRLIQNVVTIPFHCMDKIKLGYSDKILLLF